MIPARTVDRVSKRTAILRGASVCGLALAISVSFSGCGSMFWTRRPQLHRPEDGVLAFSLPRGWNPRGVIRERDYTLYEFGRTQAWWLGAGDPLEAHALVVLAAPDADEATLRAAMDDAFRRASSHTRLFPDFGSQHDGSQELRFHEGSYQISPSHDPERVLAVRALDRARGAGFVARVHLRKTSHERLRAIRRGFFDSLVVDARREAYFAEIRDWPAVRAARLEREVSHIDSLLTTRGLPPVRPGETVTHHGWTYSLWPTRFVIGRLLGSRALDGPVARATGEVAWLEFRGGAWEARRAYDTVRPKGREPYHFSADPPARWATGMGPELDRSLAWFFTVRACELTGEVWEPPRDPAACDLDAWFEHARRLEADFRADRLPLR